MKGRCFFIGCESVEGTFSRGVGNFQWSCLSAVNNMIYMWSVRRIGGSVARESRKFSVFGIILRLNPLKVRRGASNLRCYCII